MKNSAHSGKKALALPSPFRSFISSASSALGSVVIRKILVTAAFFFLSLVVAGVEIFPGTYPLGLSLLSSTSGLLPSIAAYIGAIFASPRLDSLSGIYILSYSVLFVLRFAASVWLSSGKGEKGAPLSSLYNKLKDSGNSRAFFRDIRQYISDRGGTVMHENVRVRIAVSAVSALFSGAWVVTQGGFFYYDLFGTLFSLITVPLFTYLFYAALSRNMRASRTREIGIYFVCAAVSLSLHSLSALPVPSGTSLADVGIITHGLTFDFGALAAFIFTMFISLSFGAHRGVLCGLICGAVLTPIYAPAYAAGAIACGALSSVSSAFAVMFGGTLATAWGIYVGGLDGMALLFPPIVVGCAFVIPTYSFGLIRLPPDLFMPTAEEKRRANASSMSELSYGEIRRRTKDLSGGLLSLSAVLGELSDHLSKPDKSEMREIVESVFSYNCATCKNRENCFEVSVASYDGSTPLTRKMTDMLTNFGAVTADVIPTALATECYNMDRILDEINLTAAHRISSLNGAGSLSVTSDDYALVGDLIEHAAKTGSSVGQIDNDLSARLSRSVSRENFSAASITAYGDRRKHIFVNDIDVSSAKLGAQDIRELFEKSADCRLTLPEFRLDGAVLSMEMHSETRFSCKSGFFSHPAKEHCSNISPQAEITDDPPSDICGDVVSSFEYDARYYLVLSDGMGTGKEAALTSRIVVSLLEKLITSGADLECALKMLNGIIRSAGRECSATVDIAEIDMMTGEAKFIKSGAAPSFIIRDGSIFRLQSKTVPIGIIRALDAEMIRFDICEGDTVVMLSDGAARSYDEVPWLLDMMTNDKDIVSGNEAKAAEKIVKEAIRRGSCDDITAGVVRMKALR